jgi:hypothetical protein
MVWEEEWFIRDLMRSFVIAMYNNKKYNKLRRLFAKPRAFLSTLFAFLKRVDLKDQV